MRIYGRSDEVYIMKVTAEYQVSVPDERVERGQKCVPFFVTCVPFSVAQVVKNGTDVKWRFAFRYLRFVCCDNNDKKRNPLLHAVRFLSLSKIEKS